MQSAIREVQRAAEEADVAKVKSKTRANPKLAMGRDMNGSVALHYGAKSGNVDIVRHLLDCYPDAVYVEDQVRTTTKLP